MKPKPSSEVRLLVGSQELVSLENLPPGEIDIEVIFVDTIERERVSIINECDDDDRMEILNFFYNEKLKTLSPDELVSELEGLLETDSEKFIGVGGAVRNFVARQPKILLKEHIEQQETAIRSCNKLSSKAKDRAIEDLCKKQSDEWEYIEGDGLVSQK